MSNENDIRARFDSLMNQYGYDEEGRPTNLLMRAFHEGVLNHEQLGRLQGYFSAHRDELSMVGNEDDDTPLPAEYEQAAEEIVRRVVGDPVPPDLEHPPVYLASCLTEIELGYFRSPEREMSAKRGTTAEPVIEFVVDPIRARQSIMRRLQGPDGESTPDGDRISGLSQAFEDYASSARLSSDEREGLHRVVSDGLSLLDRFMDSDRTEPMHIALPSDEASVSYRVSQLVDEHRDRFIRPGGSHSEGADARWKAMQPSILSRLTQPWSTLISVIYEALRAGSVS